MSGNPPALRLDAVALGARYARVRATTQALCAGLSAEDCQLQSMAEASPLKWHLAHTTWFFEAFVLARQPGQAPVEPALLALFNSYYQALGTPFPRAQRGLLSRPDLATVRAWRAQVDALVLRALGDGALDPEGIARVELGLQHEQQHQELMLTDLKHAFAQNPLQPRYAAAPLAPSPAAPAPDWVALPAARVAIGAGEDGFAFDHERPRHVAELPASRIAARLLTCGAYQAFIRDGGYRDARLWCADGWDFVQGARLGRPLYWSAGLDSLFTLHGEAALDPHAPVVHLSWYEADACARWAGARLPTEAEWERFAQDAPVAGVFADGGRLHPRGPAGGEPSVYGNAWCWTATPFSPYPGYRPPAGALGEYNGKFMCNQFVLRGGSCASPREHLRASYRNFFPPAARWQFSGLRLAQDERP